MLRFPSSILEYIRYLFNKNVFMKIIIEITCFFNMHILINIFIKYFYDINHEIYTCMLFDKKMYMMQYKSCSKISYSIGVDDSRIEVGS